MTPPTHNVISTPAAGGMRIPTPNLIPTTTLSPTPWPIPTVLPIETAPPTVSATNTLSPEFVWYMGGTLYTATIAEWRGAEPRNRLATAAEWVVTGLGLATMAEIEAYAPTIQQCVDRTIDAHAQGHTEAAPAVDVAALCLLRLKEQMATPTTAALSWRMPLSTLPATEVAAPQPTATATTGTAPFTTVAISGAACDCSGNIYNCGDLGDSAQVCFDYCREQGRGDIHDLDRDNDLLACE